MRQILLLILISSFALKGFPQKIEFTFSNPTDTVKNFYVAIHPAGEIKGSLILLPGFGESPRQTLIDSDIYKHASAAGYLTIIPALGDWDFFYLDLGSQYKLDSFLNTIFKKYRLKEENFFIGGFSIGGTMAIRYAERAYIDKSDLKKPAAVFGVDPPLDIERLYNRMTDTNRKLSEVSSEENKYFSSRIQETFKTNPKENPEYFWSISPFSRSDSAHSALKSILKLPLRIYNDPDINWHINNRFADYYDMNVFDSSGMINWLRMLGNNRAELVTALGKGFRNSTKERHPHSWSIVDGKELMEWLNSINSYNK